jgi:hypothetical protein
MNTEVYIRAYGDTVYTRVDIQENVGLPVTYSFPDIREQRTQSSYWSKTLKLPGTKTNNILFKHIFELSIDDGFNPNKKADVYVLQDSLEVLRGILQLKKIIRSEQLNLIYYECDAYGGTDDFFTNLGKDKLTELDFSAYDHTYNRTNQANSWTAAVGSGYVYPMIDYFGKNPDDPVWFADEFLPALYAKEYIDKIFVHAEKTYTSAFLTSDFFKRLIIPFSREQYRFSNAEIIAREFRAERITTAFEITTAALPTFTTSTVLFQDDSTGLNYDPSALYNTSTGTWTVAAGQGGRYTIKAEGNVIARLDGGGGTCAVTAGFAYVYLHIKVNGSIVQSGSTAWAIPNGTYADGTFYGNGTNVPLAISVLRENILLSPGDAVKIDMEVARDSGMVTAPDTIHIQLQTGSSYKNEFLNVLAENASVSINACIPENITMEDFFRSIAEMFRLHMQIDPDNPNNYLIEPRDDWYDSTIVDWSDKLDRARGLEIIPMAELQGKKYIFRYKEDRDYFNDQYQKTWLDAGRSMTYGQHNEAVDNDFARNDIVVQPIFSATPIAGDGETHNRVIPKLFQKNGDNAEYKGTNIRILYWAGLIDFNGEHWEHGENRNSPTLSSYTQYPYAGHVDNPYDPGMDLSFGVPKEVYWDIRRGLYTDNNLYNKYHKRAADELADPAAGLVSGWFRLRPTDIFQLSFRCVYRFESEHWRLNKIIDYDLSAEKLTLCEFIKAKDTGAYVPTQKTVTGGIDDTIGSGGGTILPRLPSRTRNPFENLHNTQEHVVTGTNNNVAKSAMAVVVIGDDNVVGQDCANISIMGSNNIIYGGVKNATLIRCDGLTIKQGDCLYVNNCPVDGCITTDVPSTETISMDATISNSSEIAYVDTSGGARSITLPTYAGCDFEKITVLDKTGNAGANNITVNRNGTDTIRGANTWIINTNYAVTEFWKTSVAGVWTVK